MNPYVQRMKTAIAGYGDKAKAAEAEIERAYSLYQEEPARNEEKRIREKLAKERRAAEAEIDAACNAALENVKTWGTLDGKKMTDDVKLLDVGVTPKQFAALVDKYQDNYTMLNALQRYADKANENAPRDAHGWPQVRYETGRIPTPESKTAEWEKVYKGAYSALDTMSSNDRMTRALCENIGATWGDNIEI